MSLVGVPQFNLPRSPGVASYVALATNIAGRKAGFGFQCPQAGTIDRICFRTAAVTVATDTDVRLETIDTSTGSPSGTLVAAGANATVLAAALTANTWIEVTLTTPVAVTALQYVAVVLAPTGTPTMNFAAIASADSRTLPWSGTLGASTWTKVSGDAVGAIRYNDGTYPHIPGMWAAAAINSTSLTAATTPDEVGNLVILPFNCRATGLAIEFGSTSASNSSYRMRIYDAYFGTVLISKTLIGEFVPASGIIRARFDTTLDLVSGGYYRIAVEALGTVNRSVRTLDAATLDIAASFPLGANCVYTERTNAGIWSQTLTRRANIGLLIDEIDAGGGAGPVPINYGFA